MGALAAPALLVALAPRPRLPRPTGPHAIGTTVRTWTDDTRPEPFTVDPADRRSVVAQIWYPAELDPGAVTAPYLARETVAAISAQLRIPGPVLVRVPGAPTHAVAEAPPAAGRHPVLVHLTGRSGFRGASQAWVEDLVSHGYVVIGLDQPGTAVRAELPDGRILTPLGKQELHRRQPQDPAATLATMNGVDLPGGIISFLAGDVSLALDGAQALDADDGLLAGHLDLERAGVFGVSLGGYLAPEACRQDGRLRACLAADARQSAQVAAGGSSSR